MKCEIQLLLQFVSAMEIKSLVQSFGIKCLSNLLQLEPCNVMFKLMSDMMAHWYDL